MIDLVLAGDNAIVLRLAAVEVPMTLEQHRLVVEGGVPVATVQAHAAEARKETSPNCKRRTVRMHGVSRGNCAPSGGRNATRV